MYPVIANGIRTGNPCGFNKECSLKFCVGSQVQQTPEECWKTYQLKSCGNNNKDEDNSPKILNDKKKLDVVLCIKKLLLVYRFEQFLSEN